VSSVAGSAVLAGASPSGFSGLLLSAGACWAGAGSGAAADGTGGLGSGMGVAGCSAFAGASSGRVSGSGPVCGNEAAVSSVRQVSAAVIRNSIKRPPVSKSHGMQRFEAVFVANQQQNEMSLKHDLNIHDYDPAIY
jgi:hypothetical protein